MVCDLRYINCNCLLKLVTVCESKFEKQKKIIMKYSIRKIKEQLGVQDLSDFRSVINSISESFFESHFYKSKSAYCEEILRLFDQIDNDYHFVCVLKQEKYVFQLQWKENVLKAHLDLLKQGLTGNHGLGRAV